MSRKDPQEKAASQEAMKFVATSLELAGAVFLQADFKGGRYWFEYNGKAYALDLHEPQGPLPDLTGKKKISTPENPKVD